MLCIFLIFSHFLADYGLQTEYVALNKGKNLWPMLAHCSINAFIVVLSIILYGFMVTSAPLAFVFNLAVTLGCYEFVMHFIIDTLKCNNVIGYNTDQLCHIIAKILIYIAVILIL